MIEEPPVGDHEARRVGRVLFKGTIWVTLGEALAGGASLLAGIIAAHILAPSDFGLMGTVMLAIAVLESLTVSGFEQALVQRDKDVEPLLNVAWTWHVLRGLTIATVLVLLAPFLARFYDEPRLSSLLMVSSLYLVLYGFQNVGIVFFTRKLDFRTEFAIKVGQALFSTLIYIPAVLILRNTWALAIGYVGGAIAKLVISYVAQPFRPRFEWDREKLRHLLGFGKWITGMTFMVFIITQGDAIFVSKYLGLTALGLYQLSYNISNFPATNITHVISRVSFPTYARLQNDPAALKQAFMKVMKNTVLVSGLVSVVIWAGIPIVVRVIGEKWAPMIPLVRVLVIAGFVRSFAALAGAVFHATGRPDLDFKMNLPRLAISVGLIWPACAYYGIQGACYVVLVAISTTLPMWFYGIKKQAGVRFSDVVRVNAPAALASGALAAVIWGVHRFAVR